MVSLVLVPTLMTIWSRSGWQALCRDVVQSSCSCRVEVTETDICVGVITDAHHSSLDTPGAHHRLITFSLTLILWNEYGIRNDVVVS